MEINNVNSHSRFDAAPPEVSGYGKINSEQKQLLHSSDLTPEEVKAEYLLKESEKLAILPGLSDDQKAMRMERAEEFIDRKISQINNLSSNAVSAPPFEAPGKPVDGPPKKRRVGRVLKGLHRAEAANHENNIFGKLTSEQWKLIGQFRKGEMSLDEVKSKFLENEETKLLLLLEANKITEAEKDRRLERFSGIVEKILNP